MSAKSYLRGMVATSGARPKYAHATRGAAVWLVFILIGIAVNEVELGFQAGFVGWIASYTDDAQAAGRRFAGIAFVTIVGAIATFLATLAGNYVVWSVIGSAGIGAICVLFGVTGPAGVKKGLVTMFLALFAIGFPASVSHAGALGIATLVGGAATALVLGALLLCEKIFAGTRSAGRRRRDVAARFGADAAAFIRGYAQGAAEQDLAQRRTALLVEIRDVYSDARYNASVPGRKDEITTVDDLTGILRAVVTFADVRALAAHTESSEIRDMYDAVAQLCTDSTTATDEPQAPDPSDSDPKKALAAVDAVFDQIRNEDDAASNGMGALRDLRRNIHALTDTTGSDSGITESQTLPTFERFGPSPFGLVWTNLRDDTLLRRHMFRYVTLIAAATLLYKLVDIPDGYFIPLGINIMLQPDLATGFSRVQVFSVGTVIGSVIGALIGVYLADLPFAIGVLSAAAIFCVSAYYQVTYWAFAIGISTFIVSVLGLLIPGGWDLGLWRILDTLIAAAFVAIGLLVLWPSKGKIVVPREISRALLRERRYLAAALATDIGLDDRSALEKQRRGISAFLAELGMRVEQYSKEPGNSKDILNSFREAVIDLRHMQASTTELAQTLRAGDMTPGPDTQQTARAVGDTMSIVADAFGHNRTVAQLPLLTSSGAPDELPPLEAQLVSLGVSAQTLASQLPYQ